MTNQGLKGPVSRFFNSPRGRVAPKGTTAIFLLCVLFVKQRSKHSRASGKRPGVRCGYIMNVCGVCPTYVLCVLQRILNNLEGRYTKLALPLSSCVFDFVILCLRKYAVLNERKQFILHSIFVFAVIKNTLELLYEQ